MACMILDGIKVNESSKGGACFYDSTTGVAFGPVFESGDEAEHFMEWIKEDKSRWGERLRKYPSGPARSECDTLPSPDPRSIPVDRLCQLYAEFHRIGEEATK